MGMVGKARGKTAGKRRSGTPRASERKSARSRMAENKAHYLRPDFIRIGDDGRRYSLVLDEPKDRDRNRLGLTHGTRRGYDIGGCQCPACSQANSRYAAEKDDRRLAIGYVRDQTTVAMVLTANFPGHDQEVYEQGGATVVDLGIPKSKRLGTRRYSTNGVMTGLRNWCADNPAVARQCQTVDLAAVAARIEQELTR